MLGNSSGPLGALKAAAAAAGSSAAPDSAPKGAEDASSEFDPEKIKAILSGSSSLEDAVKQLMDYLNGQESSEDEGSESEGTESEAPSSSDEKEPAPTNM